MPVPIVYRKSSDVTANYNYVDVAEGTGIIDFYPFRADGLNAMSTTTAIYSNLSPVIWRGGGGADPRDSSNYDVTFNLPKSIKGKSFLSITIGAVNYGSSATPQVVATLYKVDLSNTSTQLATATATGAADVTTPFLLYFPITRTHFKKGETLRLNLVLNGATTSYSAVGYGVDPAARVDPNTHQVINNTNTTRMILKVPFVLDV